MNIADLEKRYSATTASIKARGKFLHIDLAAITPEDIDKLDALNDHLDDGGSLVSFKFVPSANVEIISETTSELAPINTSEAIQPMDLAPMAAVDFDQLLKVYEFLQRASDAGWHLPTAIVRSITGSTPRGQVWKRFGFQFEPATRHGAGRAWSVKPAENDF